MRRATETMGMIIRRLRREHGLTQEELAASIGVTAQAVSKWEKDLGMPDISQIVPLAGAFNVRTDVLFGLEVDGADAAIERAAALEREAGYSAEESVGLWRELKRLYPRNCGVRFRLAGALLRCGDHKRAAEQYEYILGECTDGELRAKTLDMLCFCYHNIGDTENAVRVAMLCPPVRKTATRCLPRSADMKSITRSMTSLCSGASAKYVCASCAPDTRAPQNGMRH